jgi:hypothetical protein
MDSHEIKTNVQRVREELAQVFEAQQLSSWSTNKEIVQKELETKFQYTSKNFPMLWRVCLMNEPGTMQQLNMMLDMIEKVQSGTKKQNEADEEMGYMLFDTWAKPHLNGQVARDYNNHLRQKKRG